MFQLLKNIYVSLFLFRGNYFSLLWRIFLHASIMSLLANILWKHVPLDYMNDWHSFTIPIFLFKEKDYIYFFVKECRYTDMLYNILYYSMDRVAPCELKFHLSRVACCVSRMLLQSLSSRRASSSIYRGIYDMEAKDPRFRSRRSQRSRVTRMYSSSERDTWYRNFPLVKRTTSHVASFAKRRIAKFVLLESRPTLRVLATVVIIVNDRPRWTW